MLRSTECGADPDGVFVEEGGKPSVASHGFRRVDVLGELRSTVS